MKINKINIQTSNRKHATDIAMLVDKPAFLYEIERLRQKWQVIQLYEPRSTRLHELLNVSDIINKNSSNSDEEQKRLAEFNQDIEKVLQKFNRGKNFKPVIEYSLFTGVVPDRIYQSCYFDVVTIAEPDNLESPERYEYVIVLSPRTEQQEIVKAYKEFKNHIKGKIKFHQPRIPLDSPAGKDFYEAVECLKREEQQHSARIETLKTADAIEKEYAEFLKRTEKARDYFLSVGDLDADIADHLDLIQQYHKGNIYNSADIDKFKTLKELERTREWYWIAYCSVINNNSKKPLAPRKILEEWKKRCPYYTESSVDANKGRSTADYEKERTIPENHSCQYCDEDLEPNLIMKALPVYLDLLGQS